MINHLNHAGSAARYRSHTVFTTGEVAEICGVSQQTIIRAFDTGRLVGFRVPGSKSRRIPRPALVAYMRANNVPLTLLEGAARRVLVVESDPESSRRIMQAFTADRRFEPIAALTGYDAGALTERCRPQLMVLQHAVEDLDARQVCEYLRSRPDMVVPRVIVIGEPLDAREIDRLMTAGMDDVVATPFEVSTLIERAENVLYV